MAESLPPGGEVPCLDVHCKHDGVRPTARGGRAQTGVPGRCTVSLDDAEHESNTSAFTLTTIAKSDPHSISGICIALYLYCATVCAPHAHERRTLCQTRYMGEHILLVPSTVVFRV